MPTKSKIEQLREERVAKVNQARKILDDAQKAGRDMTAEESAEFDKVHDAADELGKKIKEQETADQAAAARADRQQKAEAQLAELERHGIDPNKVAGSAAQNLPGAKGGNGQPVNEEDRALAVQGWMLEQTGHQEPTDEHRAAAQRCGINLRSRELTLHLCDDYTRVRNALKSNVPNVGGVLKLGDLMGAFELALLQYGPMMEVAQVIRTSHGNPFPWPTANDTSNSGRQIGESKVVTSTADPSFKATIWGAYKFTSDEILIPFELLRDSAINLAAVTGEMLGERIARILNTRFTVGTGAATAYGIVPRSTLGKTAASASAIAADELFDLQHSVPRAYRKGAGFMCNDNTVKAIRKLKDSQNRYLWEPSLQLGQPDRLLTWSLHTNDDMADIATGAKTMLAGDFSRYKVRQVNNVRMYRLTERHRENDQDAFLAFMEADGNLLDPGTGPVRHLIQA